MTSKIPSSHGGTIGMSSGSRAGAPSLNPAVSNDFSEKNWFGIGLSRGFVSFQINA